MLYTLEVLPAAEGDCLLLHWGTRKKANVALIDGGPGRVYEETLRMRLDDIVVNLERDQLLLEFVMVSHMDNDHIIGVKKLTRAVKKQVENAPLAKRRIRIQRMWLNVFNDVLGDSTDRYYQTLTASVQASVGGKPNPKLVEELAKSFQARQEVDADAADYRARNVAAVLAGHGDGRNVRDDQKFLFDQGQTAALNSPFAGTGGHPTLITLDKTPKPIPVVGLNVTVIGPMKDEIDALQEEFDEYIKQNGLTAEAVLAAYADDSIKNLSSIVCLCEFGTDENKKRILLTGDARGDRILEGLKRQNLLDKQGRLEVDILKVPHHGSDRNVEPEFFEAIIAKTYVLSGNGKYGNPERETLDWIVEARGQKAIFDLVLTYDVASIDAERKRDFDQKQQRKKKAKPVAWNKKKQSLAMFFKEKNDAGYKFSVTVAPVTIDLGDENVDY